MKKNELVVFCNICLHEENTYKKKTRTRRFGALYVGTVLLSAFDNLNDISNGVGGFVEFLFLLFR
jgi:hypothetical protein